LSPLTPGHLQLMQFHLERIPISAVPTGDAEIDKWLLNVWTAKEAFLTSCNSNLDNARGIKRHASDNLVRARIAWWCDVCLRVYT
jgi:hypothetical protein